MSCDGGFIAHGEVILGGAQVGRGVAFNRATLHEPLIADGLQVDQGVFCDDLKADAEVSLVGAHVGGQLSFRSARLSNEHGAALKADHLEVDGDIFFGAAEDGQPFDATGELRLPRAHVGGQLSFHGARLTNQNGPALNADGLQVDENMFCRTVGGQRFEANGELRLRGLISTDN
jgi:adhesin HecA-like repeat protein